MRTAAASPLPPLENAPDFAEYLSSLGGNLAGWRAVHLAVSALQPAERRRQKFKEAALAFQPLLQQWNGRFFRLPNADIVVLVKGAPDEALADAAAQAAAALGGEDAFEIARGFDLARECDALLEACAISAPAAALNSPPTGAPKANEPKAGAPLFGASKPGAAKGGAPKPRAHKPKGTPMQPADLARVEASFASADVASLLRRQTVCQLIEGERPKAVFRELYVSIADLEAKVAPGLRLASNRWLFLHLTRALDARVLTQLVEARDPSLGSHISLNLNVASLMSPEFLAFDHGMNPEARRSIVLELQLVDILADMSAFQFARDFAHERGYSLCLDGLTYLTAPLTDRALLGLDLVKIIWSPDMLSDEVETRRNAFAWMIDKCGDGRAILCRCDGEEGIRFGQSIGVTLFQGIAVDSRAEAVQAVFAAAP